MPRGNLTTDQLLNGTLAGKIVKTLDAKDGISDKKIQTSVWNEFIKKYGGQEIAENEEIPIKKAMVIVTKLAIALGKKNGLSTDDMAKDMLKDLGADIGNFPKKQEIIKNPPKYDIPKPINREPIIEDPKKEDPKMEDPAPQPKNDNPSHKEQVNTIVQELTDDINYKKAGFIPSTGPDIAKHLDKLNADNISDVIKTYQNKNGASLVYDILQEWGLSKDTRIEYIGKIKNAYAEFLKKNGTYSKDLMDEFDRDLKAQMNKIGFAESNNLDFYIKKLDRRKNYTPNHRQLKDTPNGKIDKDFNQGGIGDCWAVAAIKAIANNPKGLKILNDSLKVNDDGSVTVTLKGLGKSYTVTPEEIKGNSQYTSGDADVRAIEIAMDKYYTDLKDSEGTIDLNANTSATAFKMLIGDENIKSQYGIAITDDIIDSFNNPGHIVTVSSHGKSNDETCKNTTGQNETLYRGHAHAVIKSDKDYVYLANPHDTSKVLAVPREQFKKFFNVMHEINV